VTAAIAFEPPMDEWTTDDLDELPPDGRRRELIDGVLIVSPSPSNVHQIIAGRLMTALEATCPPEFDVTLGVEIRVSRRRSLTPDVMVVNYDAAVQRPSRFSPYDVALAVEVMSPSSMTMDRVTKPALYAQAGIPFYWRIETHSGILAYAYRLDPVAEVYRHIGDFDEFIEVDGPWAIKIPIAPLAPRYF